MPPCMQLQGMQLLRRIRGAMPRQPSHGEPDGRQSELPCTGESQMLRKAHTRGRGQEPTQTHPFPPSPHASRLTACMHASVAPWKGCICMPLPLFRAHSLPCWYNETLLHAIADIEGVSLWHQSIADKESVSLCHQSTDNVYGRRVWTDKYCDDRGLTAAGFPILPHQLSIPVNHHMLRVIST